MKETGRWWRSPVSMRLRAHFRSNVVGYIALFAVIIGGTAQALPGRRVVDHNDLQRHVVHRGNIHDQAVETRKLDREAVTRPKLASNSVNSAKVADGSLTGEDIDELTLVGVAAAGLRFDARGEVAAFFNNVGGEPTVEMIDIGHFRVTIPGLEEAVAAGRVIVSAAVQSSEPAYVTHDLRSDGAVGVLVWDSKGEPATGGEAWFALVELGSAPG